MTIKEAITFSALLFISIAPSFAQKPNDVTAPLHLMKPDYPVAYGAPEIKNVKTVLDRVFHYLDSVTPVQFVHRRTGEVINSLNTIDTNTIVKPGDYRLTSYEWGVTYSGMLEAGKATGDKKIY